MSGEVSMGNARRIAAVVIVAGVVTGCGAGHPVDASEDGPLGLYTMREPAGATSARDSSGNGMPSLIKVPGLPLPTFSTSGASFSESAAMVSDWGVPATAAGLEARFSTTDSDGFIAAFGQYALSITPAGHASATTDGGTLINSAAPVNDGQVHRLAVTNDGTTAKMYVDGSLAGSQPSGPVLAASKLYVGQAFGTVNAMAFRVSDVAVLSTVSGQPLAQQPQIREFQPHQPAAQTRCKSRARAETHYPRALVRLAAWKRCRPTRLSATAHFPKTLVRQSAPRG